ncbi:MAG: type IV secretion system DNA-binding domain-containing protein [Lachnospiraceae bacterium]|nr:type IV secretion system DNA-binding domain-containing protein [Lachnospiraceae bacterium]
MHGNTVKRVVLGTDIKRNLPTKNAESTINLYGMAVNGERSMVTFTKEMLMKGTALIGQTGSGKTYCAKKMVKELRKNLPSNYSMVIVQAKNDFDECVREGDFIIEQGKNSKQSVHWNLFKDILKDGYDDNMIELNTREFVAHLFADKKDQKEQFFVDGARELLYCVIVSYIRSSKTNLHARKKLTNKGLRDFFLQYSAEDYKELLEKSGEPGVLKMILGEGDNLQGLGVYGELVTTVLTSLVDIFAMDGDFSIREFVDEKCGKALFINYDPAYKDSQVKIYSSIIKLVLKETLSQNGSRGNVILVCDELPTMGRTDIAEAVNLGRAKGLISILGMQSIAQLYSIYGEYDGQKLLSGMCTKLYFRPNDVLTRQYMIEDFGKVVAEYMVLSPGGTCGERRESMVLEDEDVIGMHTGDCFVKCVNGDMFQFYFE